MRSQLYKLLLVNTMLFAVAEVYADDSHSKTLLTVSKAHVITPISLVNTGGQGLEFGVIAIGSTNSKVVISATATAAVTVLSGNAMIVSGAPQKAAKFTVFGEADQSYAITLPESAVITSGSNSLTVSNFTCSNGSVGKIGTNDLFYIGGQLSIPTDAVPAVYQGTFNVVVAYN